ncbi:hypothetical protein GH714_027028 [Hevea brasiliensis]|uniref:Rx N-terminal domain-containing protein n=1 Tax=Hevea brasiliensis TaxID=3981 RepID=A0A6A6L5I2_HEVBR|nr:hypothetical protein GH714_027028 [Hevea brasiliensis]
MADALIGGTFLSAFLQVLFDRIACPEIVDFFTGRKFDDQLLSKLQTTLKSVNGLLDDAEEKQISKPAVRKWVDELKDAVYEADDLLDEIAYEALRSHLEAGYQYQDDDKKAIMKFLLSNDENSCRLGVIPILGMGGVGKTTLAQLVYNDRAVEQWFDLKAWVCVSEEFHVSKKPLKFGAPGSKIIVTTRNESTASNMCTVPAYHLKGLTEDDCWLLFAKHAFHDRNFNSHPSLEVIEGFLVQPNEDMQMEEIGDEYFENLVSRKTLLREMPSQMGKLTKLARLTDFFVKQNVGSSITELGKLQHLHGQLCIWNLQNVLNVRDAMETDLKGKKHLKELELRLSGCKHCCSLPPFGQLASLKDLSIREFDGVVAIGPEFYGSCVSMMRPFSSLEILRFEMMPQWREWISYVEDSGAFPLLQQLYIRECPNLTKALPSNLPSLTNLRLKDANNLWLHFQSLHPFLE